MNTKQGSVIIFFLAFVLMCIAFISFSLFVGSRVHHQVELDQAAEAAARAGAAHEAVGLNMIAGNNLAIASALQINHSLVLMAYYAGFVRALMYTVVDGLEDVGESFTEVMNMGHNVQTSVFDNFNTVGAQFYKAAQGISQYNQKIRDYWVYLAFFKVIELGRLNDPGALVFPYQGEQSGVPLNLFNFKYSPSSSSNVSDKLLYNSKTYDAICMTSGLAVPDPATHDSMIPWISGPLTSIPELAHSGLADVTEIITNLIKIVNDIAPVKLGLIECGIGLKSSIFDLLAANKSWATALAGLWGEGITSDIVSTWDDLFTVGGQALCGVEKAGEAIAIGAVATFSFGKGRDVALSLSMKKLWESYEDKVKTMKEKLLACYPQPKPVCLYRGFNYTNASWCFDSGYYSWVESVGIPNDSCCASVKVQPGASVTLYRDSSFRGGAATFGQSTPDIRPFGGRSFLNFPMGFFLVGEVSSFIVSAPNRSSVGSNEPYCDEVRRFSKKGTMRSEAGPDVDKIIAKMIEPPVFHYSSKTLKECKMDENGNLPSGCDEVFHLEAKSYLCPFEDMILKYTPHSCSFNLKIFGVRIATKQYPADNVRRHMNPRGGGYNCDEYKKFESSPPDSGMQLISWGAQANAHRSVNDAKDQESNLGFMVINKAKRAEFFDQLSIKSLVMSPIWNSNEYERLKNCNEHQYSIINAESIKRCQIELYRQVGFGSIFRKSDEKDVGTKEMNLVEGNVGGFLDNTHLFLRSQWAFAKYRPMYLPMPSDYYSQGPFSTHLLTLWPSWTVTPGRVTYEDFSSTSWIKKVLHGLDWFAGK